MENKFNIAVLIDGDNAQPSSIKEIIEEALKHGKVTIRRIYGDWTANNMNGWKQVINQYSVSPVQKFEYTTGKNSTDGALIIDAMDILHGKKVDGFCIVSSDSDYTGLAKRIREEGLFVMGIGEKKTPEAFVKSCEVFTFTENLKVTAKMSKKQVAEKTSKEKKNKVSLNDEDLETIYKAFEMSIGEEERTLISKVGMNITKLDPSFDFRTYGFQKLTQLIENLEGFNVIRNEVNGLNHPMVEKIN